MSGVWVFEEQVLRLVANPFVEDLDQYTLNGGGKKKVLVYMPTNEVIRSYVQLESKLVGLGWQRYSRNADPGNIIQFHKSFSSSLLISLPKDSRKFKSMHMYDIVLKNRGCFEVREY